MRCLFLRSLALLAAVSALSAAPAIAQETQLTGGTTDERPAWSPDGTTILFDSNRTGNRDLWTVPAAGGSVSQITFSGSDDSAPEWSPDGSVIAYSVKLGASYDLYTRPYPAGSPTVLHADTTQSDIFPSWSPDSSQIAFTIGTDVWIIAAAGGSPVQLTTDPATDSHPSWSPDGLQIAFQSNRSGNDDVWILPVGGGSPVQLTFDPATDGSPDWSPDGTQIAFQSNRAGGNDIWAIAAGGGVAVPVTSGPGNDAKPDWSPDGSQIAFGRGGGIWITTLGVDLQVEKSVDVFLPDEGDTVTFTVVVSNPSPVAATGVEVTDVSPAGLTFASSSATQGSYTPGSGLWTVGALAVAASETLTLCVTVDPGTAGQVLTNVASLSASDQSDGNAANDSESASVTVSNVLLTSELQITGNGGDDRPAWSPDDSLIAFDGNRLGNRDLFTVPVTGGPVTTLTFASTTDRHPDWSPGASQIVFAANPGGGLTDLWIRPAVGGTAVLLDSDPTNTDGFPAWSPDSSTIAYRKGTDIYLIAAGGGVPVQLTSDPATDSHPTWSPDGTQIAFRSDRAGTPDLWIVPAAGGSPTQLTSDPAIDDAPDWSPDGTRIAFSSDRGGDFDVWLIPAAGGPLSQVTTDSAPDVNPDWSPAGDALVFSRTGTGLWIATLGEIDVGVSKTVDDPAPDPGNTVTYTIVAANAGPGDATGVALVDSLPAGVTYQGYSATQGTWDSGTGAWSAGTIVAGTADTLTISVTVDLGTEGQHITNVAAVTATNETDANSANDSDSAALTVTGGGATSALSVAGGPDAFQLSVPRPNPFHGEAVVAFDLPVRTAADVAIYDLRGRLVRRLVNEELAAGHHAPTWNGRDGSGRTVAPGVYLVRLRAGGFEAVRKAVRLD